jgi:SAM-dependent methyltransferase
LKNLNGIPTLGRPENEIREQYELEKELANRLMDTPREMRSHAYVELYNELFRRIPHHPQLVNRKGGQERQDSINRFVKLLSPYLSPESSYLEIGVGDCHLAWEIAKRVKKVIGIDVSAEISQYGTPPENFQLELSDGTSIPVLPGSIDLAFSNQLVEHLHPEDLQPHLKNVLTALKPGCPYLCLTPNRTAGPCDISQFYDSVATGFHLREYDFRGLSNAFLEAGFRQVEILLVRKGKVISYPKTLAFSIEKIFQLFPDNIRKRITKKSKVGAFLSIKMLAIK